MKGRWNSLVVGGCHVIGMALLALSVTVGGSAVRAAGDSPVLDSGALEPLMKLAEVFQQRIAKIEASVAAYTESLTTRRVATQELCVADETGARTCITKAQLDALLKGAMQQTAQAAPAPQAAQAPASPATPASAAEAAPAPGDRPAGQAACPEKCVLPEAAFAAAAPSEAPAAGEAPASAAVKETVAVKETAAPATAGAKEAEASAAIKEPAPAAVPPLTQPAADPR